MKINNPTKFFPSMVNMKDSTEYNQMVYNSVLISRGDIIKKYAPIGDEQNEDIWHKEQNTDDKWVKFSFDGGITYPLKLQFKNDLVIKLVKTEEDLNGNLEPLQIIEFDLSEYEYSQEYVEAARNGLLSLASYYTETTTNADGEIITNEWYANIPNFSYSFDDNFKVKIKILSDVPLKYSGIILTIGVDGSNSNALAVSTPTFSSNISAIPTVYDEDNGICNYLDENFPAITCLTKFENINSLSLKIKIVSPIPGAPAGNTRQIKLRFKCGKTEVIKPITLPSDASEKWEDILVEPLTGTLVIERIFDNEDELYELINDTKRYLTVCITNIRMERI